MNQPPHPDSAGEPEPILTYIRENVPSNGDADGLLAALRASTFCVPLAKEQPEFLVRTSNELGTWLCAYTSPAHLAVGENIVDDDPRYRYEWVDGATLIDDLLLGQKALPVRGMWINLGSDGEQCPVVLAELAHHLDRQTATHQPRGEGAW